MLNIFKHSRRLLTNSSIKVTASFLPKMSSNTRSLRSRASVKTEEDISDNKGPQSSLKTSKYFQNKQEQNVPANNKVVKGTKTAKVIKIKQENQKMAKQESVSTKTKKIQALKTVIKTEPNASEIVKTEVLSDDDFTPKSTLTNSQKGKEQKSTKSRKMQAQKNVIKTEPDVSQIVKTEVLSDDDFTRTDSKLEIQKAATADKVSPLKRKPVQKSEKVAKVKTEHVQDVEDFGWEPENWRVVLDNILQMRKLHVAPVDSLGCEECPEKGVLPEVSCI